MNHYSSVELTERVLNTTYKILQNSLHRFTKENSFLCSFNFCGAIAKDSYPENPSLTGVLWSLSLPKWVPLVSSAACAETSRSDSQHTN